MHVMVDTNDTLDDTHNIQNCLSHSNNNIDQNNLFILQVNTFLDILLVDYFKYPSWYPSADIGAGPGLCNDLRQWAI